MTGAPEWQGLRAAIIDLDGTMVDTMGDFVCAINALRADWQLAALPRERIATMVGKGSEHLLRQVLACDFAPAQVEQRLEAALDGYLAH